MFGIGTFNTKPLELILWVDTPWVKERRVLFYIYEPLRFGVGVSFLLSVHAVVRMWVHETYGMQRFVSEVLVSATVCFSDAVVAQEQSTHLLPTFKI